MTLKLKIYNLQYYKKNVFLEFPAHPAGGEEIGPAQRPAEFPSSFGPPSPNNVILCPGNAQPKRNFDGDLLACLPNFVFCPTDSACLYNGMNFFCCPMEMDPSFISNGPSNFQPAGPLIRSNFSPGRENPLRLKGPFQIDGNDGFLFQPLHAPPHFGRNQVEPVPQLLPPIPDAAKFPQDPLMTTGPKQQLVNPAFASQVNPETKPAVLSKPKLAATTNKPVVTKIVKPSTPGVTPRVPIRSTLATNLLPLVVATKQPVHTPQPLSPPTIIAQSLQPAEPILAPPQPQLGLVASQESPLLQQQLPALPPFNLPPQAAQTNIQQMRLMKMAKYNYVLDGYPYEEVVLLPAPMPTNPTDFV